MTTPEHETGPGTPDARLHAGADGRRLIPAGGGDVSNRYPGDEPGRTYQYPSWPEDGDERDREPEPSGWAADPAEPAGSVGEPGPPAYRPVGPDEPSPPYPPDQSYHPDRPQPTFRPAPPASTPWASAATATSRTTRRAGL